MCKNLKQEMKLMLLLILMFLLLACHIRRVYAKRPAKLKVERGLKMEVLSGFLGDRERDYVRILN